MRERTDRITTHTHTHEKRAQKSQNATRLWKIIHVHIYTIWETGGDGNSRSNEWNNSFRCVFFLLPIQSLIKINYMSKGIILIKICTYAFDALFRMRKVDIILMLTNRMSLFIWLIRLDVHCFKSFCNNRNAFKFSDFSVFVHCQSVFIRRKKFRVFRLISFVELSRCSSWNNELTDGRHE